MSGSGTPRPGASGTPGWVADRGDRGTRPGRRLTPADGAAPGRPPTIVGMRGTGIRRRSTSPWLALALLFVGLFGATVAASGLWAPLPLPKAGGTCGPGLGSETAIAALVNPASIGAGAQPPATQAAARAQWIRFVDECQTATNHRVLITVPVLVVSLVLGVTGLAILWRRFGRADRPATPPVDRWPPAYGPAPGAPPPYAASYPGTGGPTRPPGGVSTV